MKINHWALALALAGTIGLGAPARAAEQDLANHVKEMERRLSELEGQKAGAETNKPSALEAWLGASKFSGFASVSYLYNFNRADTVTGRTFDVNHNEFAANKLKLALEKPTEFSGEKWDAGYRADLIFGQDARVIQSAGLDLGKYIDLEQLYASVNVPIGRGLQVQVGKWVTLMGVEVIEEVANPNWSEGNQFLYVENFTGTGVQLCYKWTDKIDTQFRVYNGWDVVKDNNSCLSYMGRVGFLPDDKTSIAVVGFAGPEQANDSDAWRYGVNVIASRKLTDKLTVWLQGDYGTEDQNAALPVPTKDASWWAGGIWVSYDFCDYFGLAVRGDYVNDCDGARTSGAPFTAPFPANTGQELTSLTVTFNIRPIKNLQVRPEIRWDHSSESLYTDSHGHARENQVTAAIGVAYLF